MTEMPKFNGRNTYYGSQLLHFNTQHINIINCTVCDFYDLFTHVHAPRTLDEIILYYVLL